MKKYIKHALTLAFALFGIGALTVQADPVTLSIRYDGYQQFCISKTIEGSEPIQVYITPYPGYKISSIIHYNGARNNLELDPKTEKPKQIATDKSFKGGLYTYAAPGADRTLNVQMELDEDSKGPSTGVEDVKDSQSFVTVLVSGKTIVVEGAAEGDVVTVTNLAGVNVYQGFDTTVEVDVPGVYVVTVGETSTKVAVH